MIYTLQFNPLSYFIANHRNSCLLSTCENDLFALRILQSHRPDILSPVYKVYKCKVLVDTSHAFSLTFRNNHYSVAWKNRK